MTQFYDIKDNTSYKRGMPETTYIVAGLVDKGTCPKCGAGRRTPTGDLRVRLGKTRARIWPDAIACGDYPCFVVSERFVTAMTQCGIRLELGGQVTFDGPVENGLSIEDAPNYFWIDGNRSRAGKMDFEASGYVDVRFCSECGVRNNDISRTYDRQHSDPAPGQIFDYDDTSGLELFTTDLAPTVFFCTKRVLDCAREHKLTNLAFRPVEQGAVGEPLRL